MENASDALIMAGQILIFIIALTVCISSFSILRKSVDSIIGETETVKFAKGEKGYLNYIEADNNKAIRKEVIDQGEVKTGKGGLTFLLVLFML